MNIRVYPPEEIIETTVSLPLSKSMSNRALIMNALTPGASAISEVAVCDDTRALQEALAKTEMLGKQTLDINIGAAGTAMRFLTAYFAAFPNSEVVLDGCERMRHRPIAKLVDALRLCGADIEYVGEEGYPPLRIKGHQLHGGEMEIDATISSQYLSAILMVAPTFSTPLSLKLIGEISSLPYLNMTISMMQRRGIDIEMGGQQVRCAPGQYLAVSDQGIERDWSAASYWYEIAAMSAGWVTLQDMDLPSMQGDSVLAKIYEKLGIITQMEEGNAELNPSPEMHSRLELDLRNTPDIAQTLAVTCCLLGVPFRFQGLESLKIKETDRLEALRKELAKLSFDVDIENGSILSWENRRIPVRVVMPIETYGDHRMAMAFAPVSIFLPGLTIKDAEVVSKSYPAFWDDLKNAGFRIVE